MLFLNINTREIQEWAEGLDPERVKRILQEAAADLSQRTSNYIVEEAEKKLHSRFLIYREHLKLKKLDDNSGWEVVLEEPALWIEEGLPPHEMIDNLLAKNAKISVDPKTGKVSRWKVIPFKHNQAPSRMTQAGLYLQDTLKKEMRKQKIPWGKMETDSSGNILEGLVRSFDVEVPDHPHSRPHTPYGPGVEGTSWEGAGPKSFRTRSQWTGDSYLAGVRIYQQAQKAEDGSVRLNKRGEQMGIKEIMTFRVVSDKQKGTGMWNHPGLAGVRLFDEAYDWAKRTFDEEIAPQILSEII